MAAIARPRDMKKLVIATRRSRLALWQAEHIKQRLEALHAGLQVELLPLSTRGDARADLAVHSMKDVPVELPPGFAIAAIPVREDPRDVFVSMRFASLAQMPAGASVGTSSLRRAAQIVARYPALEIRLLRGNVDTRLAKLDRGEYDAIVLAAAGLKRLGLDARATARLAAEEMLPAPGQGALGIECLAARAEVGALLAPLADSATTACVRAERAVSRALGGNCTLPLAAFAEIAENRAGNRVRLRALVASSDGKRVIRGELEGEVADPEALGHQVAQDLRRQGADAVLGL